MDDDLNRLLSGRLFRTSKNQYLFLALFITHMFDRQLTQLTGKNRVFVVKR